MAIFISYSHADSDFVDTLATNLVRKKHHVWMDRWELNLGDSITAKIQERLTDSGAILVILSKTSVESEWCKRELTAGLVRELEERQTLVLPIIIDDCKIPLFLKDKLSADFRKDPDKAFDLVDRSLARISNATTSRVENPKFHTDFSVEWKKQKDSRFEETWILRWTFVDHGLNVPYAIISECKVYVVNNDKKYLEALESRRALQFARKILGDLSDSIKGKPLNAMISDNKTQFFSWTFNADQGDEYLVIYSCRRLGLDTGMDTIVYLDNNIAMALKHLQSTVPD